MGDLTGADRHRARMRHKKEVVDARIAAAQTDRGVLRGHTFHYSRLETTLAPIARGICPNGGKTAEAVYRAGRLTASYVHFYYPSNQAAVARLFAP